MDVQLNDFSFDDIVFDNFPFEGMKLDPKGELIVLFDPNKDGIGKYTLEEVMGVEGES